MRLFFKPLVLAFLMAFPGLAQIPAPQINLSGNIGCQGFPCVNSGTLNFPSDANHTMTPQETSAFNIKVTSSGSLTATRNLIAPAGRFQFTIENLTTGGQAIQIIGASGTGVTIANGTTVAVWNDGTNYVQVGSTGGAVSSVSNSDGSFTFSPTTGAVVGSLNTGHANTWTGQQTFSGGTYQAGFPNTTAPSGLSSGNQYLQALTSDNKLHLYTGVTDEGSLCSVGNGQCPQTVSSLTTTGSSGPSTLSGGVLNVPTYALANQPSQGTLITDYDFHDGTGTTVTDVSGNGNNMTLTSGTPGGTTAPRWIKNPVTNVGIGVAMGTDSLGSYSLPTTDIGTSCETVPVLQNGARTVLIQYFNPAVGTDGTQTGLVTYDNSFAIQDWLGSSNGSIGYDFNSTGFVSPWIAANTGGSLFLSSDNMIGFHTDIITFAAGVPVTYYHDGQPVPAWAQRNIPSLVATNWVLGCNGTQQVQGGGAVTAPTLVFRLSFWSNALNSIEVQQAYGFVTNNLLVTKGFQPKILPAQTGTNQYIAIGDSQVEGIDGLGSGSLFPYVNCALTNTCYSTTYNSSLLGFGGRGWTVGSYGMPGAGPDSFAAQIAGGLGSLRGDSNFLHVADILGGTNGLTQPPPVPCPTIQNLKAAGFDAWVETLFSLNPNPAIDRANPNRDSYNFSEMQSAPLCGATGVIDISSDAFIGADGTNGGAPPGGVGVVGVHLSPSGEAYKMQLNARVLNAYYQANPNVQTVYSAASVTLNGWDRYTTFSTGANAITANLPDCIGMVNMPYFFIVSGANTVTLNPAVVSGQTELINGTSSYVMAANSVYKFLATTRATQFLAPGGCNWVPAQAPGGGGGGGGPLLKTNGTSNGSQTVLNLAGTTNLTVTDNGTGTDTFAITGVPSGSGTASTLSMFTAPTVIGDSPISVIGAYVTIDGSHFFRSNNGFFSGKFKNDVSYNTCSNAAFQNYDGSGIAADGTYEYICGYNGVQAAHLNSTDAFFDFPVHAPTYNTATNCASPASPAVCGSAASGSVVIAASAVAVVVNTTAVTANSQIHLTPDLSLGTRLGVTCATDSLSYSTPVVTARSAGASFTVGINTSDAGIYCLSYTIEN